MRTASIFLFALFLHAGVCAQQEDAPFSFVENMPVFPGGKAAMDAYFKKHLVMPEEARQQKINGVVVVQFVVNTDSTATAAQVVRRLGYGCDEEAVRVVDMMNRETKWIPGSHVGRQVRVYYSIPVPFKAGKTKTK